MTRKPRLSAFAANLLEEWRRLDLPASDANVVVAVSGGADSTALLVGLDELIKQHKLQLQVTVAHLDHGLRDESRKDAQWVVQLAEGFGYETVVRRTNMLVRQKSKPVGASARKKSPNKPQDNLEQAARKARYSFLLKTAGKHDSNLVLTGHTLDDQAETILLRLLRGSAAEGLSGTPAVRELERGSDVKLVRPLLSWARRSDTEDYCRQRGIDFRRDEMNDDETFARVRVRKQLLPLMKSFNNRVVEALSRTAALLNEDAVALADEAVRVLELAVQPGRSPIPGSPDGQPDRVGGVRKGSLQNRTGALADARASAGVVANSETNAPTLSVSVLRQAPPAVRRRALREWILRSRGDLKRVEMVHLLGIEKLLQGERGGRVAELPGGMQVTRKRGRLELSRKNELKKTPVTSKIPRSRRRR